MSTTHVLKTWPEPFAALVDGRKTGEYRRDDRDPPFTVGDALQLREWDPETEEFTGRVVGAVVSHVAREPHVPAGFAMLSLAFVEVKPDA